ncbi:MAG TPA: hypothetical protein VFB96_14865 [Pirellulaceae bacterium]|nr:hypothetical protein [Pirellulaceae bacterium]
MQVNPYESPREAGYRPPKPKSGFLDGMACIATALLIHAIVQAIGLACLVWDLNFLGALRLVVPLIVLGCFTYVGFCLIISRWRKRRPPRLRVVWD